MSRGRSRTQAWLQQAAPWAHTDRPATVAPMAQRRAEARAKSDAKDHGRAKKLRRVRERLSERAAQAIRRVPRSGS
jgi:hypothetical protein